MTQIQIYNKLAELIREVFMDDTMVLRPDSKPEDVEGWDSFKTIEIAMAVENRFAVEIHSEELDSIESVEDIVALIQARQRNDIRISDNSVQL